MRRTFYCAEVLNERGDRIERSGVRDGREAKLWALEVMPDACSLILRVPQGQWRGWYVRDGGVGEWRDFDPWGKSV